MRFVVLLLLACLGAAAHADGPATDSLAGIVELRASVPAGARTAATLGREREGSGIVIDDSGLVATIGYLVMEASAIEVRTLAGRTVAATPIAYDPDSGIGLVRASNPLEVPPVRLGRSAGVAEGQRLRVAAHGGAEAVQPAIVTARREFAGYWEYLIDDAIFTAPPHPGFGGAALLGTDGRLLGIGYLFVPNAAAPDGVMPGNMFVPVDRLADNLGDLLATGRGGGVHRPWLGLYTQPAHGRLVVARVQPGSPAAQAGLTPGDVLLGVGEERVGSLADLYRRIWAMGDAGAVVPLRVLQGSQPRTLPVKSIDRADWLRTDKGL